jgi:hypothetical protein
LRAAHNSRGARDTRPNPDHLILAPIHRFLSNQR